MPVTQPSEPSEKKVAPPVRQLPPLTMAGKVNVGLLLVAVARQRDYLTVNTKLATLYGMLGAAKGKAKVSSLRRQLPWTLQQSRSLSPTLVAEYQTALPSKALLRRKLYELYAQLAPE